MTGALESLERLNAAAADTAWRADFSPLGDHPVVLVDFDGAEPPDAGRIHRPGLPVVIGIDRTARSSPDSIAPCDILLTFAPDAPAPWVYVAPDDLEPTLRGLAEAVARNPVAASIAVAILRLGESLAFDPALTVESLAYSTLLAGAEHRRWREARPPRTPRPTEGEAVRLHRDGARLTITLARPQVRNAFSAAMRDGLTEAFALVEADPSLSKVELRGEGPSFCAGGDLWEFGLSDDPALAHVIRSVSAPALAAHRLRDRLTARVHGACVGAGIELAAAAGRIIAKPDAWFWLPELGMGLIPGAGGTVTLPRRIGRSRTCFAALSGARIDALTALGWGLVDEIEPAP